MDKSRSPVIRRGLDALYASRAHRVLSPLSAGPGLVFMLHHVRPMQADPFDPNALLAVTPEFLECTVNFVRTAGFDVIALDEVPARLAEPGVRRFCAFTFDDGYRDVRDHALPVLARHGVPSTIFVTSSFADGTGTLWWHLLEEALRQLDCALVDLGEGVEALDLRGPEAKQRTWSALLPRLRRLHEEKMREIIDGLAARAGLDARAMTRAECLNWDELRGVVKDPLVTIGAHTVHHPMLAQWPRYLVVDEMAGSRADIARQLGTVARHIAYPVGDPASAGAREFEIAREIGFETGWTTRPGHLFRAHARYATALPRVSLNGHFQAERYLDLFVSGAPFALWNGFRRVNAA